MVRFVRFVNELDEKTRKLELKMEDVIKELKEEKLKRRNDHVAAGKVLVFEVHHGQLTAASGPDQINAEETKTIRGRTFYLGVAKNAASDARDHYGIYLHLKGGHLPCKVKYTMELVHHDDDKKSVHGYSSENTYEKHCGWGQQKFVQKEKLADASKSPYVKDGMVTFRCTVERVDG